MEVIPDRALPYVELVRDLRIGPTRPVKLDCRGHVGRTQPRRYGIDTSSAKMPTNRAPMDAEALCQLVHRSPFGVGGHQPIYVVNFKLTSCSSGRIMINNKFLLFRPGFCQVKQPPNPVTRVLKGLNEADSDWAYPARAARLAGQSS
ncbi:hypothetical protein GCM10023192_73340 [Amycolatopsis samaneae]